MMQTMSRIGSWLRSHRLVAIATIAGLLVSLVGLSASGAGYPIGHTSLAETPTANWIAYNVDLEMDKARKEKTVEHYGESIRDVVEQATQNNENNPDGKPTAKNTYERESQLNEVLPEKIGEGFSQKDLKNLEN